MIIATAPFRAWHHLNQPSSFVFPYNLADLTVTVFPGSTAQVDIHTRGTHKHECKSYMNDIETSLGFRVGVNADLTKGPMKHAKL